LFFFKRSKSDDSRLSGQLVDSCNYLSFYLASEQLVEEQFAEVQDRDFASAFHHSDLLKEDWHW
jgi:hypothetical protein